MNKIMTKVNTGLTKAVVAGSALIATSAWAGPMADAVKAETTDVKADLYSVGGIIIGFVVVATIVGATIRMLRRGG